MPRLPRITGKEAIKAFSKVGFILDHIEGSHHILRNPAKRPRLSIPVHSNKIVGLRLLKTQINLAGISVEEFEKLL